MSQDEIAVMDGEKCILQLRGVRHFLSDKYDITQHKRYCQFADYDRKNAFDIEKCVKNVSYLNIRENMEVDASFNVGDIT